jgi:hypothetical protein
MSSENLLLNWGLALLLKIVLLLDADIFPVLGIKDSTKVILTTVYCYVAALAIPEIVAVFAFRFVVTQLTPNCVLENCHEFVYIFLTFEERKTPGFYTGGYYQLGLDLCLRFKCHAQPRT